MGARPSTSYAERLAADDQTAGPGNLYSMSISRFSTLLLAAAAVWARSAGPGEPAPAQRPRILERFFALNAAERVPADTPFIRYVKLRSERLSGFHRQPVFLHAGVLLPRDYHQATQRRYPLWVRTGGFRTRYTFVRDLGSPPRGPEAGLPRFLTVCLDGVGPYGDPSQVNSDNNGPYGDAITKELIPHIEREFRGIGQGRARFLQGTSTGGWASLALQVFYPDFFNGAYAFWPDPVDFRAFETVNIYQDANAYRDARGQRRAARRDGDGDVVSTISGECREENGAGGGSYTLSGGQWGSWNAIHSPRGPDGNPVPLWDPATGAIDREVAEQWKRYDLSLVLRSSWRSLGPKLRGKLHIWVGEDDDYFLDEAVHLLHRALTQADPPFAGTIFFHPGGGHGDFRAIGTQEMLGRMEQAMGAGE